MSTVASRRRPWPWHVRLAKTPPAPPGLTVGDLRGHTIVSEHVLIGAMRGVPEPLTLTAGFMLVPQDQTSLLIAKKQVNLENLYPATAEYDSAPVYRERTFQFRPTGGIGEPVQAAAADRRYHYGINVWVTGGLFGKGPLCHTVTPAGTATDGNDMLRLWREGPAAGDPNGNALYYVSKKSVWRRNDDSNAGQGIVRTRAGHHPMDMIRFQGAYAGAKNALYVTWEDGVLEEYDGTTWATAALPAGFAPSFLEVVGGQLWGADRNGCTLRNASADPKVAGSWSGPILVGNPSTQITALRQSSNQLAIYKSNGTVFTLNSDGTVNDLFPGLATTADQDNGRTATAWLGQQWFRSGRAFYQLDLSGIATISPRGPGRNLGNLSEVRGPVQAFAGWNTQMAFAGIYNSEVNNSYMLSYGSWVPRADPESVRANVSGTAYQFVDQFDGALCRFEGQRITSMFVSNIPTEARVYVGFLDGTYQWAKLVPFPLIPGQGGEYTLEESYIVMPLHHAMFQSDNKSWTGASIFGPGMRPGNSVSLSYRVMGRSVGTGATPAGSFLPWGLPLTQNGSRSNPENPIAGKALELKIDLINSVSSETPILEGLGLHERLVPAFRRDWTFTVNASDYVARRDGATTRQSGPRVRQLLEEAASAPASITLILPDEVVSEVGLFTYEERQLPFAVRGSHGWAIGVQATQFQLIQIYGTIGRTRGTTIGQTRGFDISDMRFF